MNSEKMQISSQDCKKLHMLKCHRKIREFRRRIVEKSEIQQRVTKHVQILSKGHHKFHQKVVKETSAVSLEKIRSQTSMFIIIS